MAEAGRLTRSGQLQAATEALQRAMRDVGAGANVPPFASAPPVDAGDGMVIDVQSRVLPGDAEPSAPQEVPSSAPAQWLKGSFAHQGRQLDYRLFVPPLPAGAPARARPMVVMLHGCTQDADDFAAGTGMNALASEAGVLVLYPEQKAHANAQRCWNWFKPQHQDSERGEPALIAALVRKLIPEQGVDASRVYVAGLSAGGAMAAILGQCCPDLFAAVGVHSGLPAGAADDLPSALAAMRSGAQASVGSAAAVPLIVFHGDADTTVHPRNGALLVEGALRAQHSGSAAPRVRTGRAGGGQGFTCSTHSAADGQVAVEYWQLHGAGHAWSGGSASGSYTDPKGVDASAEMLRFFLSHRRVTSV